MAKHSVNAGPGQLTRQRQPVLSSMESHSLFLHPQAPLEPREDLDKDTAGGFGALGRVNVPVCDEAAPAPPHRQTGPLAVAAKPHEPLDYGLKRELQVRQLIQQDAYEDRLVAVDHVRASETHELLRFCRKPANLLGGPTSSRTGVSQG